MVCVKICGITSPDDAHMVASAGTDAIGINFYPASPRYVGDVGLAREIAQAAGPFTTVVGLFVNESAAKVEQLTAAASLDVLQFHGDELPEYCRQFARSYVKALRMKPGIDIGALAATFEDARGILLDAYRKGVPGGTGETFDWQAIPALSLPLILAGGLKPDNVAEAVRQVQPNAVDVSGGIESAPGKKHEQQVREFVRRAKGLQP